MSEKQYRPCVGLCLFNKRGEVFIGQRVGGVEHKAFDHLWQMPQGGIDRGEDPLVAAYRELFEETNIRSVKLLAEIPQWLSYDLPHEARGQAWTGRYAGQTQKWFAMLFTGDESEIDILKPGAGQYKPEFKSWKWAELMSIPPLVIDFKRDVYDEVVRHFSPFAKEHGA
jgi:putative (di)nucleoside polyphosphate hydrolase